MLIEVKEFSDFEIVIGLVSPIGTDLDRTTVVLEEELRAYGYTPDVVRLSLLLDKAVEDAALPPSPQSLGYYEDRMEAGDRLRERYGNDALAGYAVAEIMRRRADLGHEGHAQKLAWILWSLKHEEEIELLRTTYGRRFFLLGLNAPVETRRARLRSELQDALPSAVALDAQVAALVERDQLDPDRPHGQHVRDAYCKADYFAEDSGSIADEMARFVGLLFGKPFITPTKDEVAMYVAFASSLRSADPGRQVGAVITDAAAELCAIGCNEVPKPGGGEYWSDDDVDNRDFRLGYDFNKRTTTRALREVLDALADSGHLSNEMFGSTSEERLARALSEDNDGRLKNSRMLSLIEFGRIVHAEMSAITQASRGAGGTRHSTLYTTSYPCHMCMRLIIASGITRVVYVDPYPKSLARDMYETELDTSGQQAKGRVRVEPFVGASWSIYPDVFRSINRERTDKGLFKSWSPISAVMRLAGPEPIGQSPNIERQIPVALEQAARNFESDKQ